MESRPSAAVTGVVDEPTFRRIGQIGGHVLVLEVDAGVRGGSQRRLGQMDTRRRLQLRSEAIAVERVDVRCRIWVNRRLTGAELSKGSAQLPSHTGELSAPHQTADPGVERTEETCYLISFKRQLCLKTLVGESAGKLFSVAEAHDQGRSKRRDRYRQDRLRQLARRRDVPHRAAQAPARTTVIVRGRDRHTTTRGSRGLLHRAAWS